ncbi:MAG: DUF6062 family protein [Candidatus Bathyarchaeia archaeon]
MEVWKKLSKHKFMEAVKESECPICKMLKEKEESYIREILTELVEDQKFREKFQKSGGLCINHFKKMILIIEKKPELNGIGIIDLLLDLIEMEIQSLKMLKEDLNRVRSEIQISYNKEYEKIIKALKKIFGKT